MTFRGWSRIDVVLSLVACIAVVLAFGRTVRLAGPPQFDPVAMASDVRGAQLGELAFSTLLSDQPDTVRFSDAKVTVIIGFRSTCPACNRNQAQWRSILNAQSHPVMRHVAVRTLAVSEDSIMVAASWIEERSIEPDMVIAPHFRGAMSELWRIEAVPATYVVDSEGHVKYAKFGVLSDTDVLEVVAAVSSLVASGE